MTDIEIVIADNYRVTGAGPRARTWTIRSGSEMGSEMTIRLSQATRNDAVAFARELLADGTIARLNKEVGLCFRLDIPPFLAAEGYRAVGEIAKRFGVWKAARKASNVTALRNAASAE
jgi:hypothetical protein